MGKGGRGAGWLLVIALLAGGGAAWFLLSGESAGSGGAVLTPVATPTAAASAELPVLPAPNAGADGAAEPGRLADTLAVAADAASAEPGEPLRLTGRVVDENGQPVAEATVRVYPSAPMAKLMQFDFQHFGTWPDLSLLAATTTGPEGSFTLDARDLPPTEPPREVRYAYQSGSEGRWPMLLVSHPAFEATARMCSGWTGGAFAAGDIVVKAGASVTGRVVDDEGRPLAEVLVSPPPLYDRFEGEGYWKVARLALTTRSGWDGRFQLDGLWSGQMPVLLDSPGRVARTLKPDLVAGQVRDLGDVLLSLGGTVAGRVLEARSGAPLADARVLTRPPVGIFSGLDSVAQAFASKVGTNDQIVDRETRTDARGEFRITGYDPEAAGMGAATLDVYAGAEGYEPVKLSGVVPDGEPLTLMLPLAGSIVVTVVDPDSSEPIRDATITGKRHAADDEWSYTKLDVITDPAALIDLGVPPPHDGVYLLSKAGSLRNTAIISAPGRATRGFILPTVKAPERAAFTAKLAREVGFAGLVVDADGRPIPGAKVNLHPPDDLRIKLPDRDERTDADGRFRFAGLTHGDWDATVSAAGFVTSEPQKVALRQSVAMPDAEYVLQRGATLAGLVLAGGAPLAGTEVRAQDHAALEVVRAKQEAKQAVPKDEQPVLYRSSTGADGRFRLEGLPAGEYEVSGPPGVEQVVSLAAGETFEITLLARNRPRLRGRVLDARGPVAGANVGTVEVGSPFEEFMDFDGATTTGPDGTFTLEIWGPGTYRVGARQAGAVTARAEVETAWDEEDWIELRFPDGQLRGIVVAASNDVPVAGASIDLDQKLVDPQGQPMIDNTGHEQNSDDRGRFEFTRLTSGRYRATITAPGFARAIVDCDEVVEGASASELRVALHPGGMLRGVVKPGAGTTLPGELRARLTCAAAGDPLRVFVDETGHFKRDGLLVGRWRCEIVPAKPPDAPALTSVEVDVMAGETAEVELTLPE